MKAISKASGLLLFLALLNCSMAEISVYSVDRDVRLLSQVNMVNFGGMGMYHSLSAGESLLRRILGKEDAFKSFIAVYNNGTPAAKVYALAYFHHSAPEFFEICWADTLGKYNPVVRSRAGCMTMEGSFWEHMFRIRLGQYDPYIEQALRRVPNLKRG